MLRQNSLNIFFSRLFILITLTFCLPVITSFTFHKNFMTEKKSISPKYPSVFNITGKDTAWIESNLRKMTLKEKCAQMIMPWVLGNYLSEDSPEFERLTKLVKDLKVGGLIFFEGDILNEANLINKMQKISDVPLLISSDFERGLGMRLKDAPEFPYNMALAAAGDLNLAYQMGKIIAEESRALGVHQNYAPVADINNNPYNPIINIRSFSEDKYIVSNFTASFIAGTNEAGVISTAKHFPGHGNTQTDSHKEMPSINIDRYNLANNELVPFIRAINSGVQSIMIGHLYVPSLEYKPQTPATLSKAIITGLLKNELNFDGLIVTDAMNMDAITKYYSAAEATVKAVEAGNDMILMPPDEEISINALESAVKSGELSIERINESVRKILSAKKWLSLDKEKLSNFDNITKVVGQKSHLRLAEEIANKSITLVKNDQNIIPVNPKEVYKTLSVTISNKALEDSDKVFENFINDNFGYVNKISLNNKSSENDYNRAFKLAEKSNLILLSSYTRVNPDKEKTDLSEEHTKFIKDILKLNKDAVIIGFNNPYLLKLFPEASTYLCAYGAPGVSQIAMGNAIIGNINIQGTLPVSIPNTNFKVGDGIFISKNILAFAEKDEDPNYNFDGINNLIDSVIRQKALPGGILLIGKEGKVIYERPFGNFTFEKASPKFSKETLFDLDAITKTIGVSSAAMILYDRNKLDLETPVVKILPEYKNDFTENLKVKDLLNINSKLEKFKNIVSYKSNTVNLVDALLNDPENYESLKAILLEKIIEKISGKTLDLFLNENIFSKLEMYRTMFNPPPELLYYCAPTAENSGSKRNKGDVYDQNAYLLGGVSGNAGLFSTAEDLAVFLQMIIQKGKYANIKIINSETVEKWINESLGWKYEQSKNKLFPQNTFGQTGKTGTAFWIDKERALFVILLTNGSYQKSIEKAFSLLPKLNSKILTTVDY